MGSGKGGAGGGARAGGGGGAKKVDPERAANAAKPDVVDLPQADIDVIAVYTGKFIPGMEWLEGMTAEDLNAVLRDPLSATTAALKIAKRFETELNAALEKAKPVTGKPLYRVIDDIADISKLTAADISNASVAKSGAVSDLFQKGKVSHFDDFLSTSVSKKPSYKAYAEAKGNAVGDVPIRIKITKSRSAREVFDVAQSVDEVEALFGSGKNFMVTNKVWNKTRQSWDITMEEL